MKLLDGRGNVQDCTIAKEYRGAKYYKPGAIVPALILARFVVVWGTSGFRLGRKVEKLPMFWKRQTQLSMCWCVYM